MAEPIEGLQALTAAVGSAVRADGAVVRFLDEQRNELVARTVWGSSPAVAAELAGSRRPFEGDGFEGDEVVRLPVLRDGRVAAELELRRLHRPFDGEELLLAQTAAAQMGIVLDADALRRTPSGFVSRKRALELAGDALGAAAGGAVAADEIVRLAAQVADASVALLWQSGEGGGVELLASWPDLEHGGPPQAELRQAARRALETAGPPEVDAAAVTLRVGEPPLAALQLLFDPDSKPAEDELASLSTFGVRAAHALRVGDALAATVAELERTRALMGVVGEAIAQLSLAHTLETAVERVAELLTVDKIAVYLRDEGRLQPAAGRGLVGPHARVGERLLSLALGPFRGRKALIVEDVAAARELEQIRGELTESGIESVLAVPLLAREELIGLLAVYPPRARPIHDEEAGLISALATQLAVAVENARLHERAKQLGEELEQALDTERQVARQLRALYEISRSFTHSLSLEATLEAVTRTVVETVGVDAAAMRMPDARGDVLETRSVAVADPQLEALVPVLSRPQPASPAALQSLRREEGAILLDRSAAAALSSHEPLVPFLDKGATCLVVPVATPGEVLAILTIVSLDPARPVTGDRAELASSIAAQAALAIDNARLYQQQRDFAEAMQRSLLPRTAPRLPGIELGAVYESSARVDVGGDVYDYLALPDGRLAVVLGDVTGHGIEAAADMAMAKFIFRSLAREHPDPAAFLTAANAVVTSELAVGKFITLAYVLVDPWNRHVACGTAGHPPPRLVTPDGNVSELGTGGLPLGIEAGEEYSEMRRWFEPGTTLVLYTDGVVEERRAGEQFGVGRLDRLLTERRDLSAEALATEVVSECRRFGGGALSDDCAIVVIKASR